VVISGGTVVESVLSPGVHVHGGANVENSVLLDDVVVSEGATVRNAVLDKNVVVPPGASIGYDLDAEASYYTVSDNGVVVLPKGATAVGP
jgi:glucose-1-phosphate adenylyltransferase